MSFEIVQLYDEIYKCCLSLVLFMAILLLLKPLSFNFYLYMMRSAFVVCQNELLAFAMMFLGGLTAFAGVLYLLVGPYTFAFRNMLNSYMTLFQSFLAMVTFRDILKETTKTTEIQVN